MKVRGDFLGPPRSTDKTTLIIKVSKGAKIRNRHNQVPYLTQYTNGNIQDELYITHSYKRYMNAANTFYSLITNSFHYLLEMTRNVFFE